MLFGASPREMANPFEPASAAGSWAELGSPGAFALGAPAGAPAGGLDDRAVAARNQLFAPYADGQLYSAKSGGNAGGATRAAPKNGTKKSATKAEVAAIQAVIDKAHQADKAAADLDREAKALAKSHDPGAHAKALQADERRRAARGLKQEAMGKAVSAYGIDISHVKSLLYSADNTDGDSETEDDRSVTIGDAAFTDPGCLGSTIAHEAEVHVNLQAMKNHSYDGPQGRRLNEIQAYDYEISGAKRFGLTKDQIDGLRRNRAHYMEGLDPQYQKRRQASDYTMIKGHEDE